jgi:hypothetical protein
MAGALMNKMSCLLYLGDSVKQFKPLNLKPRL